MKQALLLAFVLFAGIQLMTGANPNSYPELFECISKKEDTREKVDCLVSLAKYYSRTLELLLNHTGMGNQYPPNQLVFNYLILYPINPIISTLPYGV